MEKKRKSYNLIIGVAALVIIVVAVSLAGYIVSKPKPYIIYGEAEATEYRISGKVPGRIEKFFADEGEIVHKGDTLVEIDSPEVKAKLAQATAMKNIAESQKEKALTGARKEQIAGAYELWQQAKVQEDIMRKSYERMKKLYDQKVVPAQKFDETEAKYKAACSTAKAAESQYNLAVNGARKEDRDAAIALVEQANAALMEVNSYLGELFLTSPADGVISARYPKPGELVGQGAPVMTVTDLDDVWFTFNIREDMLKGLRTGDRMVVRIPALNDHICTLYVNYISVRESYATWRATKEYGQYDAKTFEVRAVPAEKIDGIRPGMSAIVIEQ